MMKIIESGRFTGLNGREIARELCAIVLSSREYNYEEIAEYLIMIANRGHYNFLYNFLKKYPINLDSETAIYTIEAIKQFTDPLLAAYGKYAAMQFRLYQHRYYDRDKNLYLGEFLDHSGPRKEVIRVVGPDYNALARCNRNIQARTA